MLSTFFKLDKCHTLLWGIHYQIQKHFTVNKAIARTSINKKKTMKNSSNKVIYIYVNCNYRAAWIFKMSFRGRTFLVFSGRLIFVHVHLYKAGDNFDNDDDDDAIISYFFCDNFWSKNLLREWKQHLHFGTKEKVLAAQSQGFWF